MDPAIESLGYAIFPVAPTLAVALRGPDAAEALRALAEAVRRPSTTVAADATSILDIVRDDVSSYAERLRAVEAYWRAMHPGTTAHGCDPCDPSLRHDNTVRNLAYITTFGFFLLIAMLLISGTFNITANTQFADVLMTMTGVVGTGWASIVSFFFGSSVGSRTQSATLSAIASGHPQGGPPTPGPAPAPAPAPGPAPAPELAPAPGPAPARI